MTTFAGPFDPAQWPGRLAQSIGLRCCLAEICALPAYSEPDSSLPDRNSHPEASRTRGSPRVPKPLHVIHQLQAAIPPAVTTGFASAAAMWCAWYVFHMPGLAIEPTASTPVLVAALLFGCAIGSRLGRAQNRGSGWLLGLLSGLVAGFVDLLLLGSKVVVQAQSTNEMLGSANRLNPDAPTIVLGFLGACAIAGAIAGAIGSSFKCRCVPDINWRAAFAVVTAFTLIPLVIAGGLVTSTESGMAVPDSVTTYGSVSFLFPLSLMSQPRIFFEHTHRLFGTFVGLTSIVLAVWSIVGDRAWRTGLVLAALILAVVGPFGLELRGHLPLPGTIAWLALVAIGALAAMVLAILLDRLALAAGLLLLLVITQGLLGALRVSEISTPLAYSHGVLAQLVFASASALAAAAMTRAHRAPTSLPDDTVSAFRLVRLMGPWAVIATATQLVLGAGFRHTTSALLLYSHALFAAVVATLALVLGIGLIGSDPVTDSGKTARRMGLILIGAIVAQVTLGITAFVLVAGGSSRPIPTYEQLSAAGSLPAFEAAFTTSHQALGAIILALVVAAFISARARLRGVPLG